MGTPEKVKGLQVSHPEKRRKRKKKKPEERGKKVEKTHLKGEGMT